MISKDVISDAVAELVAKHTDQARSAIECGVYQVAMRWREQDGDAGAFKDFCLESYVAGEAERQALAQQFQDNLEQLFGNLHKAYRQLNWKLHVDEGALQPIDQMFANYDLFAHIIDDLFDTRLAFVLLLNFSIPSMEAKTQSGHTWTRENWAHARLGELCAERIQAEVKQRRTKAYSAAEEFVYGYNFHMQNLRDREGIQHYTEPLRLITHWGLRDELKVLYSDPDGFPKQRFIHELMLKVIRQEVPTAIIDNPEAEWSLADSRVTSVNGAVKEPGLEQGRAQRLLEIFRAEQEWDKAAASSKTLPDRKFNEEREILESDVEGILDSFLKSPVLKKAAELIAHRLGRPLQPFDIWYPGFKPGGGHSDTVLNEQVQKRFPTLKSYQNQMHEVLMQLGFSEEKARYLQQYIQVDPARGAGHAMGAKMRYDHAHLRTRVPGEGMDYQGFNTAMHELGHTVEQVFSLNDVDHYILEGVPNTAFTEAFAFLFQSRDLEILGLTNEDPNAEYLRALSDLWQTMEISGVALLDMKIWRWMYSNPDCTAEELQAAILEQARSVWNTYFADIIGISDQELLAIYSHIIYCGLYTPDYALGHIICYQIDSYMQDKSLADEMERMCKLGRILPQVWMNQAVGGPISAASLLESAESAIQHVE